jgi:hypothetical protein
MGQQSSQEVINGTTLPVGVNVLKPGTKARGFKYYENCRVSSLENFKNGLYTEASICWSHVIMEGTIVRPKNPYNDDPDDDLRSDTMTVGKFVTPSGIECDSAVSPYRHQEYWPNTTSHEPELNKDPTKICEKGLHCCATMEKLRIRIGSNRYTLTTRDRKGNIVEQTSHKIE